MRRWLRRLAMISSAAALLALAGCAPAPSASHSPGTTPSPSAPATTTTPPPVTAPATPTAAPTAAPTPATTPVATPAPTPMTTPVPPFPWPSGVPTVAAGQVEFALLVAGTPAPGETLSLYFQAPHAGQNQFQLCGGPNPCRQEPGQVYTWGSRNIPAGASPWAIQKSLNGTTTTIQSGTLDAARGAVVTAVVQS